MGTWLGLGIGLGIEVGLGVRVHVRVGVGNRCMNMGTVRVVRVAPTLGLG